MNYSNWLAFAEVIVNMKMVELFLEHTVYRAAYWTQRLVADKGNPRLLWRSLTALSAEARTPV